MGENSHHVTYVPYTLIVPSSQGLSFYLSLTTFFNRSAFLGGYIHFWIFSFTLYVRRCICLCTDARNMYVHAHEGQRLMSNVFFNCSLCYFSRQDSSLIQLGWLAGELQESTCLYTPTPVSTPYTCLSPLSSPTPVSTPHLHICLCTPTPVSTHPQTYTQMTKTTI